MELTTKETSLELIKLRHATGLARTLFSVQDCKKIDNDFPFTLGIDMTKDVRLDVHFSIP